MVSALWLSFVVVVLSSIAVLAWKRFFRCRLTVRDFVAWDVGACISILTLASVASTVVGVLPNATVVDIGALIVTAMIAGLFLGASLSARTRRLHH